MLIYLLFLFFGWILSGHAGIDSTLPLRFIIPFSNINIRVYNPKNKKTLKMTLDIDLADFALALMNLADFLYAHVKGIIISDQLWPRAKK